ncbi:DNA-processing protein DprA [Rickettsiales endosymbiont of Paramecium tredecaurelia]|uniref:DNA-processing protein DprA n=1 Tax=Candidatus Sarmatiella mevalonica TaxID=2770581 RepID=UPI0019229036|nr:DNA-processing protein DprA [Candidatus Sarmatiella mevalonica]MBL3284334.1 DNA-processing protein DprA [Candidatus Sarmatiella mevalonica]
MLENFLSTKSQSYDEETISILRLIRSENIGPITFFHLIKLFGNASKALLHLPDFARRGGKKNPLAIYSRQQAESEIELINKSNAKLITYLNPDYSKILRQITDPPPVLICKGRTELMRQNVVAVVGARNASSNGLAMASKLAKELMQCGYYCASGLARGIDAAVHKADTARTIALLAGDINHIYPQENTQLYHRIAQDGLLISESPIGTVVQPNHFSRRNRLISGISLGTVVIEASLKSGSLITARTTLEQNRELFVVPGFPMDPRYHGSNKLLKNGAHLVENINDITEQLTPPLLHAMMVEDRLNSFKDREIDFENIQAAVTDDARRKVMELLTYSETELEHIIAMAELDISVVCVILLELELAGKISRTNGKICLTQCAQLELQIA